MSNFPGNAQYPVQQLPSRVSLDEISANHIEKYVVLPLPPNCKPKDFETIGRTTFKKYVIRLYSEFFSLEPDCWNIPFLLLPEAINPYIMHRPAKQINTEPAMNIKSEPNLDTMVPSHSKFVVITSIGWILFYFVMHFF